MPADVAALDCDLFVCSGHKVFAPTGIGAVCGEREVLDVEFYELFLAPHSREDALPHQRGTREHLVVTAGHLELVVDGQRFELDKGDAIVFGADVPHSYVNLTRDECWLNLVMTYGRPAGG